MFARSNSKARVLPDQFRVEPTMATLQNEPSSDQVASEVFKRRLSQGGAKLPHGVKEAADLRIRTVKRATCPVSMQLPEIEQCVTPPKKQERDDDEEQLLEDSDPGESPSNSDDEEEDQDQEEQQVEDALEKDEEMKKKELAEIKEFALANGFDV